MADTEEKLTNTFVKELFRERKADRRLRWAGWFLRGGMLAFAVFAFVTIWFNTVGTVDKVSHKLNTMKTYAHYVDTSANVQENKTTASILVVPIRGTINGYPLNDQQSGGLIAGLLGSASNTVLEVRRALQDASARKDLAEIVLFIESPGGAVTPSDEIYSMLLAWKKEHPKVRVSAYLYGVAASGGYYVAMAADTVVTNHTTMVGSIGVIMQTLDLSEFAKKFGIKMTTIKSGEMKDIGNLFREMTEAEREVLLNLIRQMHERFVDIVHAGRPELSRAAVEKIADGRVFTAHDALKLGLVDTIIPTFEEFVRARAEAIIRERKARELFVLFPSLVPGF